MAYVTIFLIFLLEWKRYNNQQQSQINVPSISDQLILEQDILNFNDDDGGDWHKGRQLLKKPNRFGGSSGASTTSMNEPETEVKAGGSSRVPAYDDDDKNFGESGKYYLDIIIFTWEVSRFFLFVLHLLLFRRELSKSTEWLGKILFCLFFMLCWSSKLFLNPIYMKSRITFVTYINLLMPWTIRLKLRK